MPYSTKLQQAHEYYSHGEHAMALCLYHELGAVFGHPLFYANQLLCLAGLQPDNPGVQQRLETPAQPASTALLGDLYSDCITVSLTSYPARINSVSDTIESIFKQSIQPGRLLLWLAPEQFPQKEEELPDILLVQKTRGLQINWYDDIRSYKKLIPALESCPGQIIVTCDDDIIYPQDWLARLLINHLEHPTAITCHRAHQVQLNANADGFMPYLEWPKEVAAGQPGYDYLFTGSGGVLYPPGSLHPDVLEQKSFTRLCPTGDDLWFWASAIRNGRAINIVKGEPQTLLPVPGTQGEGLWHGNMTGGGNDSMLDALARHYPELTGILLEAKNRQDNQT